MDPAYIDELYRYNRWANGRTRAAAALLGADDFTRDLKSSFPSVRDTLTHIYDSEWTWLQRVKGASPGDSAPGVPFATVAALETRWADVEQEQSELLNGLTSDTLARVYHYTNRKGQPRSHPLWRMLVHVVNHSTYHRGQITTLLRQLGGKPVATDLVVFYDQAAVASSGRT